MKMELQAVIMAAGPGSRMTNLTDSTPKALLPIANMPMIWYPIKTLENAGFEEAILVVQKSRHSDFQKALTQCGIQLKLDYVDITNDDWGTAESLRHIKDKIHTDLLVISCDLVTDLAIHRLADLHRSQDASLTMLLAPQFDITELTAPGGKANKKIEKDLIGLNEAENRVLFFSSEADFEDTITIRKSFLKCHPRMKMRTKMMDGHLYLMKHWVLDMLAHDKTMSTIKGELVPYLVKEQFNTKKNEKPDQTDASMVSVDSRPDIYSFAEEDELMKLALEMSTSSAHKRHASNTEGGEGFRCCAYVMKEGLCIRANTVVAYCEANRQVPKLLPAISGEKEFSLINPAAKIAPRTQVGPESMVHEGSTVAEKVNINKSVIGRNCKVASQVKVNNSIIMDNVTIEENCNLTGCIICSNAHISSKVELKDCLVGSEKNVMAMSKFSNEVIVDMDRMMEI